MDFIVKDAVDRINLDSFRDFCRENTIPVSGLKLELVNRIGESLERGEITQLQIDNFVADEICHGRNRLLFISSFPPSQVAELKQVSVVRDRLRRSGFSSRNFNNLCSVSRTQDLTLVYLHIRETGELVTGINMCFAKVSVITGLTNEDGDELPPKYDTHYIWTQIIPDERKIIIKVQPRYGNYFDNLSSTKEVYNEVSAVVRGTFSLVPVTQNTKHVLYKIFKDLTHTAEKPFRDLVEPLSDDIKTFADECAEKLGLPNSVFPLNLPQRVTRLLERALIQHNFIAYQQHFAGKIGVVDRIAYSDQTGGQVNARSGQDEGIAVADIYFDTRDTIETLQMFDKIWVTWFYVDPDKNGGTPERIETKFEVNKNKDYLSVHFLYSYTNREVEDFVLSNFNRYEELPD